MAANASGLVWTGPRQVLFSEIKNRPPHGRSWRPRRAASEQRDVYLPSHERGMAHRSYASPDGKWVLLVEMDQDHGLGALPRGSHGRQFAGPPGGTARRRLHVRGMVARWQMDVSHLQGRRSSITSGGSVFLTANRSS